MTNYVHVMKYMGSKRELLDRIGTIVNKQLREGSTILDLFAGTCGVGISFRDKFKIYSNDIQAYSRIISMGIIETKPINITKEKIFQILENNFNKNYNSLEANLSDTIKKSRYFKAIKTWNETYLKEYLTFIKCLPNPTSPECIDNSQESKWLFEEYHKRQKDHTLFPYLQTVWLFSEMYFSVEQCMEIDSLKYAINNLTEEYKYLYAPLLVALIHAYSYTSAGTGHFAQFRDLSTLSSVKDVFLYRSKSVIEYFLRKAEEIIQGTKVNRYFGESRSFTQDYVNLMSNPKIMKEVNLIYADPPYSFVHYSRFYHAIEDLCLYDYPTVEHKGRYRLDRHQSPFCIKTKTAEAFRSIFNLAKKYKIPLLISYSNTGMIELGVIEKIVQEEGYKSNLLEVAHKHSTMGRQKDKDRDVTEALLYCEYI